MKISRMTASFGRLDRETLELGPGLNIVQAPNESGKSTWCAFIRAMLYGVNSSERDRQGQLSVKTRYRPWSGAAMEGEMEIEHGGQQLCLRRASQGQYPMRSFSAVFSGTAERVPRLSGEQAGETLTGVTQEVFERSAFIGQAGLAVSSSAELEKRMSSIVSAGSEEYSYTDADAELRKRLRRLRYNQRGSIPELGSELEKTRSVLAKTESLSLEYDKLKTELAAAREEKKRAEEELDMYARIERRDQYEKIFEARRTMMIARSAEAEAEAAARLDGRAVTRADVEHIRALERVCESRREELEDMRSTGTRAQLRTLEIKNALAEGPFNAESPEKAQQLVSAVKAEHAQLTEAAAQSTGSLVLLAVVFSLVAALGIVACALLSQPLYLIITGVFALLAVLVLVLRRGRLREAALSLEKAESLLQPFGVENTQALELLLEDYGREHAAMLEAAELAEGLDARLGAADDAVREAETELAAAVQAVGAADADDAVSRIEESLAEVRRRAALREAAEQVYNSLCDAFEGEADFRPGSIVQPQRSREECRSALAHAEADSVRLAEAAARLSGQLISIGDPVMLGTRVSELEAELEQQTARYNALELAAKTLAEANTEMQTRFSPELSRRASELMAELTGGRYARLAFDKKFEAEAQTGAESVAHSALYLSAGTVDQLYLALRLAMCELALPGDDPCPIILDDALANFDRPRMQRALELLMKLAQTRQVILFSCHEREAEYLEGRENVRITRLD